MDNFCCFAGMATHFSQNRYTRVKKKKNQPLSEISMPPTKRQKTGSRVGIVLSTPAYTPSVPSLVMSIEELPSPPWTFKGKEKKGENVWTNPATALGQAHNIISDDKLKALTNNGGCEIQPLDLSPTRIFKRKVFI